MKNTEKTYSAIEGEKNQAAYCDRHGCPMFIPKNGWCHHCGRNIFEPYRVRRGSESVTLGIDVETAGKRLITGCPHCNATFVD